MVVVRHQRHHQRAVGALSRRPSLPYCRSGRPCRPQTGSGRRRPRPWRSPRHRCACSRIFTPSAIVKRALQQQQVAVRQEGAVGDVEIAAALDREDALVRALDDRGEDVAVACRGSFPTPRPARPRAGRCGLARVTVSKPRFWRSSLAGTRKSRSRNAAFMLPGSILNCDDPMIALEADRGDAVLDVEPFGIDLPFLR